MTIVNIADRFSIRDFFAKCKEVLPEKSPEIKRMLTVFVQKLTAES